MLGAIFCRGCGEKLDIDSLRPEQIQNSAKKAARNIGLIIRNTIILAVILLVLGAIGLALLKPPYTPPVTLDDKEVGIAAQRLMSKTAITMDFSLDETNALVRDVTMLTPALVEEAAKKRAETGESGTFVADDIAVEFSESSVVRFVLHGKLYGKLPLHLVVTGPVQVKSESKGLELVPQSIAVGRLPLFDGYTKGLVLKAYGNVIAGSERFKVVNDRLISKVSEITFAGQQLTLKR